MDPFPVELWRQIIRKLRRPDWLALSTTCRFLQTIAQAALYEKVCLPEHDSSDDVVSQIQQFFRSLAARPELGGLMRTLSLESLGEFSFQEHPFFRKFPLFPSLRVLELVNVDLDFHLFHTLESCLPQLEDLRLTGYDLPLSYGLFQNSLMGDGARLGLLWPSPQLPPRAASTSTRLRSFQFSNASHRAAGPKFAEAALSEIITRGAASSLTTFNISQDPLPGNIVRVLQSAPQLRRVSLRSLRPDAEHPIHTLPADALPLLEHFSGPGEYGALFVTGRPVHSVGLVLIGSTPLDVLLSLGASAVPLTRMKFRIPPDMGDHMIPILNHSPATVRHLRWSDGVSISKEHIMEWIPTISRLADLETIRGRVHNSNGPLTLCEQHELTQAVSNACSSVQGFIFPWIDQDNDRWSRWSDGHWEHYVQTVQQVAR